MKIGPFTYEGLPNLSLQTFTDAFGGRYVQAFRSSMVFEAKMVLDRAATVLRGSLSRTLTVREWSRIVGEVQDASEQWSARGWFEDPSSYHLDPPELIHPKMTRADARGLRFQRMTFESGYEPHADEPGRGRWLNYERNRVAHAWVLRHSGRPRPWVMCVHGYCCGIPFLDFEAFRVAWLYKELGFNVVLPVLPFHGPRGLSWNSGEGFFGGDVLDTLHAEAHAVWDMRRILTWVRAQEATAIGVYGISLGGYNAALLAALEPGLDCVIAGIPATDFVRLAQRHNAPAVFRPAEQAGLNWEKITKIFRVISPLVLKPKVPRDRRYIFGGLGDYIVPSDQVRDLWEHWKRPRIAWYEGSHFSFLWEQAVNELLRDAFNTHLRPLERRPDRAAA